MTTFGRHVRTSRLAWARGPRIIILWLTSPPPGRDHSRGARLPQPAARATNHSQSCRMVGGMMRAAHTNHAIRNAGAHSGAQGMQAPDRIRITCHPSAAATKIQALHRGNSERSLVAARRRAAEDKKRRERKSRGKSHGHGRKTKSGTPTLCCCISVSATVEPSG